MHLLIIYFITQVAEMFRLLIVDDGLVEVTGISEKQESKTRPSGLNTVNLLKVRKIEYFRSVVSSDQQLWFILYVA